MSCCKKCLSLEPSPTKSQNIINLRRNNRRIFSSYSDEEIKLIIKTLSKKINEHLTDEDNEYLLINKYKNEVYVVNDNNKTKILNTDISICLMELIDNLGRTRTGVISKLCKLKLCYFDKFPRINYNYNEIKINKYQFKRNIKKLIKI